MLSQKIAPSDDAITLNLYQPFRYSTVQLGMKVLVQRSQRQKLRCFLYLLLLTLTRQYACTNRIKTCLSHSRICTSMFICIVPCSDGHSYARVCLCRTAGRTNRLWISQGSAKKWVGRMQGSQIPGLSGAEMYVFAEKTVYHLWLPLLPCKSVNKHIIMFKF